MANKKDWVDFKEVKNVVSMQMVLEKYGAKLKKSGDNHVGCCPIHKGTNSRQFSVPCCPRLAEIRRDPVRLWT